MHASSGRFPPERLTASMSSDSRTSSIIRSRSLPISGAAERITSPASTPGMIRLKIAPPMPKRLSMPDRKMTPTIEPAAANMPMTAAACGR